MNDINSILKQFSEIEAKIEQKKRVLESSGEDFANAINSLNEKYSNVLHISKNALSDFSPILQDVSFVYSDSLAFDQSALMYNGKRVSAHEFNAQDCEVTLKSAISNLKTSLASLLINKNKDVEKLCLDICKNYETVGAVLSSIDCLHKKESDALKKKHDTFKKEILNDIEELTNKRLISEKELAEAMTAMQSKSESLISNRIKEDFTEELALPLAVSKTIEDVYVENVIIQKGLVSSIAEWDLKKDGIVHLHADKEAFESGAFGEYVRGVIMRCLCSYPSKRLLVCDKTADENIVAFCGIASGYLQNLFYGGGAIIKSSESDIATSTEDLNQTIMQRLVLLGRSGCGDILEYNSKTRDNAQPLIFVLLHNYPQGFSHAGDALPNAFKNGRKAGVYFIVTTDDSVKIDDDYLSRKLPSIDEKYRYGITYKNGELGLIKDDIHYVADIYNNININDLLDSLKQASMSEMRAIDFESILPKEDFETSSRREDFSKTLLIPIGKNGAKVLSVDLDSEIGSHAVVCGTTGSGKSSLINTMVMAAATLYSPDELEINMISMVKSEFDIFKAERLPHLKTIITKDDTEGAIDVLNYLQDEMQRRMNIVGSDIVAYNKTAPKDKRVPRSLIIIDEYQKLIDDERAREKMMTIAQLGRSCGMCLVLSSQAVPSGFRNAITLFRHLFEFRANTVGDLIPEIASRKNELEGLPGLCFYGRDGGVVSARIAYPGKTTEDMFKDKIRQIRNKYSNFEMSLNSDVEMPLVTSDSQIPYITSRARHEYNNDGVCRIRLGKKYLSGVPLEYPFSHKNNLLCLCGDYLLTKNSEAAIVKDVLRLSLDAQVDYPTLFYIDLNKNPNWARKNTVIKSQKDNWVLNSNGRFAYYGSAQATEALEEVERLMQDREDNASDSDYIFYPIIVMLTCVDTISSTSDECDILLSLMERGKNCNVFFVFQFNEFSYRLNEVCGKIGVIEDAILVPDMHYDGEPYSSSGLIAFLQQAEAADTTAREMLKTLVAKPLNPKLNILCNNNEVSCFMPYEYADKYFADALKKE